jgi:hypothetical protein
MRIFIARRPADCRADNYFNAGRREKILMSKVYSHHSRLAFSLSHSASSGLTRGTPCVYATVLLCSRCLCQPGSRLHYKFLNRFSLLPVLRLGGARMLQPPSNSRSDFSGFGIFNSASLKKYSTSTSFTLNYL